MTRIQFEKDSASKLNTYASSVDLNRMWGAIDAELRPERKPVHFQWGIVALGLGLFVALFFAYKIKNTPNTPQSNQTAIAPIAATAEKQPNMETSEAKPSLIVTENKASTKTEKQAISAENLQSKTPPITDYQTTKLILADKNGIQAKASVSTAFIPTSSSQNLVRTEEKNEATVFNNTKLLNSAPENTTPPTVFTRKDALQSLVFLPTTSIAFLKNKQSFELPAAFNKSPDLGCYSFGRKNKLKPYLNIYGGYQKPIKKMEAQTNEFEPLRTLRGETEKVLEGWLGGVQLGMILPNGIFFEAGGEYNRINEKFQYTVTSVDTVGKTLMMGFILNAPGDTTFFQDSVFVINQTVSDRKTYNKYNYIQIPINLGYEFNTNARWSPYVRAGAMINVSFKHKAELMVSPTSSVLYESSDNRSDDPFRTKIGVSPFVSAGMRFQKSDWLAFFGEIRYQHHLKNSTIDAAPVSQKYRLPSINLGVRMFKPISYD